MALKWYDYYEPELRLYESGKTVAQIGEEVGKPAKTVQSHINNCKKAGVLTGSQKEKAGIAVDWEKVEEWKEGQLKASPEPASEASQKPAGASPKSQPKASQKPARRAIQGPAEGQPFSPEDMEILREVIEERKGRKRIPRAGERIKKTYKLDAALLDALEQWAKAEGVSTTEAMHRAIEMLTGSL